MSQDTFLRRQARRWLPVFGAWTLAGLYTAGQGYMLHQTLGRSLGFGVILFLSLAVCYAWAVLTPGIFYLARNFNFARGRRLLSLVVHAGAFVVAAALALVLENLAALFVVRGLGLPVKFGPDNADWSTILYGVGTKIHSSLLIYVVTAGVCLVLDVYRKSRERELKASQLELEARLAQAQLQVLKMQLHPHFLFNTLHAISALLHEDVELADRMVARLGELLRSTLESTGIHEVSLEQELEFIRPYLEIEQARLGPRLTVDLEVAADTLPALVPNLLLQPLVENAIRHGIAPRVRGGRIVLRSERDDGTLRLRVCDDGPGLAAGAAVKEGIGVANTRLRLEQLYGIRQRFLLTNGARGGLEVLVEIPYREAGRDGDHAANPDRR